MLSPPLPEEVLGRKIFRGKNADADGVVLNNTGEAHAFAPADCATIVISYIRNETYKYIFAHAGLESLIPNEGASLVDNVCQKIGKDNLHTAEVYIDFSISPNRFVRSLSYPGKEDYNRSIKTKLIELGLMNAGNDNDSFEVDIKAIGKKLFNLQGIENVKLGENTNDDSNQFWSLRQNLKNNDGIDGRNLIVVVRTE